MVKLTAYADGIMAILNTQRDIQILQEMIKLFKTLSLAKVNWTKSLAFVNIRDSLVKVGLPGGQQGVVDDRRG